MPAPLDPDDFPAYSGEPSSISCPKCGNDGNTTYWIPQTLSIWTNGQLSDENPNGSYDLPDQPGFLVRQCTNCSNVRGEKPLDADDPQPAQVSAPASRKGGKKRETEVRQIPSPTLQGPLYFVK